MREYLDKQKLLMALNVYYDNLSSMPASYYAGFQYAIKLIEKLHVSEEIAPVVHGKNLTKCNPVDEFICFNCGAIFRDVSLCKIDEDSGDESYCEFEFKFCPRCGMKVDLEDDE